METQIPADIQARLDVIEREASISSCEVRKPSRFAFILWVILALVLGASFMEFKLKNFGLMGLLLAISGFQIAFYFHERKLFTLYLNACEIIKYYRKMQEAKPQPNDPSNPHSPSVRVSAGR